jgi:hypothetical protein
MNRGLAFRCSWLMLKLYTTRSDEFQGVENFKAVDLDLYLARQTSRSEKRLRCAVKPVISVISSTRR